MSIFSVVSPQEILNNPLNTSVSKYQYSFPKDKRFNISKGYCLNAFYNLGNAKEKRSAGFGYGSRPDWTKSSVISPAPTEYKLKGHIDTGKTKGKSFGLSRELLSEQGYITKGPLKNPGPGQYQFKDKVQTKIEFSMRPKTNSLYNPVFLNGKTTYLEDPGPGNYEDTPSINKTGKFQFYKYKGTGAVLFNPPNSKRFPEQSKYHPGPGHYNPKNELNPQGSYILSKNKSDGIRSFGQDRRSTFIDKSVNLARNPGPGSYQMQSDFGIYNAAKDFYSTCNNFRQSQKSFYSSKAGNRPSTANQNQNLNNTTTQ